MLLWLVDSLDKLHLERDSTFFLAHLYEQLGFDCYFTFEINLIGNQATCETSKIDFAPDETTYLQNKVEMGKSFGTKKLLDFAVVFNRLEPPVDVHYLLQAKLLMLHPRVLNSPVAVQAYSEKLLPLYFNEGIESTLVNGAAAPMDGVVKPLDGFGGQGVQLVKKGDVVAPYSLVQPFNPAIAQGEHRYFVLGAQVFGELLKSKPANDFRTNSVYGGKLSYEPPNPALLARVQKLAPQLNAIGIHIAVVDFIGPDIVEINITCPSLWNRIYPGMKEEERERMREAMRGLVG